MRPGELVSLVLILACYGFAVAGAISILIQRPRFWLIQATRICALLFFAVAVATYVTQAGR